MRAPQVVSHVIIGLRTVKGTKQLKLDPVIYDALQKEKVGLGQGVGGWMVVAWGPQELGLAHG